MLIAEEGAHSVYRFIERTAERVAEGVRWQTIDYDNQPHYEYHAFNGCGGIGVFLAEYGRQTATAAALDLAREANRWCSTVDLEGCERGLLTGRTGPAMSWLYLARILDEGPAEHCMINADVLLREDPGPFTDLMGGAASNGLYLLRLWEVTGDGRYLDGARRNGAWLCEQLVRDEDGCHCLCHPDGQFGDRPFLGAAHGISGVAHYLLLLHEATGEGEWADVAREILQTLERHAVADHGGLNWPATLHNEEEDRCQWSHGAPGIGIVFLKAAQVLDEPGYRKVAQRAGEATYAYGDFRAASPPGRMGSVAGPRVPDRRDGVPQLWWADEDHCRADRWGVGVPLSGGRRPAVAGTADRAGAHRPTAAIRRSCLSPSSAVLRGSGEGHRCARCALFGLGDS